jgi:putative acetyltransferase
MDDVVIAQEDPTAWDVAALLDTHLAFARDHSPPEDVFALDSRGRAEPNLTFFAARDDGQLLAVGALRQLDPAHAELKSMHTAAAARGRGVGRAMLSHLLAVARARGCTRVSLETGTLPAFARARRMYAAAGFVPCPPFGDYRGSEHSVCMTLDLGVGNAPVREHLPG